MKKYFALILMLSFAAAGFSQDGATENEVTGFDKSKLFIGGNFGLSFGSNYTLVNVSPQIGYRFNKYIAAGMGVNFIYTSQKMYLNGPNDARVNQGLAGLNIFGRVYPINQLFLQLQPELNYAWGKVKDNGFNYNLESKFIPSLLAGAGGAIPAGRGSFIVMAQYDVIQDDRSPYGNNVFLSFGYNIGL